MLTIAGGIILAIIIILTIGIWLPLLIYIVLIALGLTLLLVAGGLIVNFPEGAAVFATLAVVVYALGELWGKWQRRLKEKKLKKTAKENIPKRMNTLKGEFVEPGVLMRNRNKNKMTKLAKSFDIELFERDTKREIAEKIFQIGGGRSQDKIIKDSPLTKDKEWDSEKERLDESEAKISVFEKIERAKAKEVSRLQGMKEKAEEKKREKEEKQRKENELIIKNFSRIKSSLQEIGDTYLSDEDIGMEINTSHAVLRYGKKFLYITTKTDTPKKQYLIINGRDRKGSYPKNYFADPEEIIDYIIHKIGVFLAKRE